MSFSGFTPADYDVFELPGFADCMAAIRSQIRPKLLELGEEMAERMRPRFGPDFYPHVASHMRRRVNPPPDTWVAFCGSRRGYKAYPHLSIGIGLEGPYIEFIVMNESAHKTILSENLKRNAVALSEHMRGLKEMTVHLDHHAPTPGLPASEMSPEEMVRWAGEVVRLKGNEFMVAWPLKRDDPRVEGRTLMETAERGFLELEPLYRCGVTEGFNF